MSDTPRSDKAAFRVPAGDDLRVIEGLTEVVPLAVAQNLERENAALRERLAADAMMRELIGWLSADIPELHRVEVPRLAASLNRFLAARAEGDHSLDRRCKL